MRISLEEFSATVAAIHAAGAFPERWPDAVSAVASLVNSSGDTAGRHGARDSLLGFDAFGDAAAHQASDDFVKWLMALLAPHLQAAREVQLRLAEALPGRLALASLDRLALAAFVADGSGAVHHLNAAARAFLADDGFLRIADSRLRFNKNTLNAALDAALREATQTPSRSSVLPIRSRRRDMYEVAVSPLQGERANVSDAPPLALVVIAGPRPDAECIVRRVRPLYGLTDAEARVMAALALGATVDEIARKHGVRPSTVRAQVRSIFDKTEVHRQSDLVRLALTGAPLVTAPDC
jgi:DNA-binding CsgD family transcriptional regulator